MTLLQKTQLINKISKGKNNRMNINTLNVTVTLEDVAKAIGESMKNDDALGAFDKVEIKEIDSASDEVLLTLSKKTRKPRAKKIVEVSNEVPEKI